MKLAVLLVCATILAMVMVTSARRKMKDADLDAVVGKQMGDRDLLNDPCHPEGMYVHMYL